VEIVKLLAPAVWAQILRHRQERKLQVWNLMPDRYLEMSLSSFCRYCAAIPRNFSQSMRFGTGSAVNQSLIFMRAGLSAGVLESKNSDS
jgi:hypothetical protein